MDPFQNGMNLGKWILVIAFLFYSVIDSLSSSLRLVMHILGEFGDDGGGIIGVLVHEVSFDAEAE